MTPDEEAEILAAARAGDPKDLERIFRFIFDRYRERLVAVCLRLTGDPSDAEDAVQECFVSVLRALPGFRGDSGLYTWIYRIAIRTANRIVSRRRRDVPLEEDPGIEETPTLDSKENELRLLRELRSLPLGPRTVLALCAIEGRSTSRVAEILGVPEGTVWSRLHTARQMLSERLKGARN